jgi:hypothetical protein
LRLLLGFKGIQKKKRVIPEQGQLFS